LEQFSKIGALSIDHFRLQYTMSCRAHRFALSKTLGKGWFFTNNSLSTRP
jgi:hypothetical protein